MLACVGIAWENTYRTPLLKHPSQYGRDPDAETLRNQLPLLASELSLVLPQRIWLFGNLPSQTVLDTQAPLSALVEKNYRLAYQTQNGEQRTADIICLPDLDYLLALPAEKGRVWQLLTARFA